MTDCDQWKSLLCTLFCTAFNFRASTMFKLLVSAIQLHHLQKAHSRLKDIKLLVNLTSTNRLHLFNKSVSRSQVSDKQHDMLRSKAQSFESGLHFPVVKNPLKIRHFNSKYDWRTRKHGQDWETSINISPVPKTWENWLQSHRSLSLKPKCTYIAFSIEKHEIFHYPSSCLFNKHLNILNRIVCLWKQSVTFLTDDLWTVWYLKGHLLPLSGSLVSLQ